jgi:hypothetical protein
MLYIKALSRVEDAPAARKRWGIDATEYTSQKYFPKSANDLQEILKQFGEYQVMLPTPCFEQGYDWKGADITVVVAINVRRENGTWVRTLFSDAVVFVMNNIGDTIDTIRV